MNGESDSPQHIDAGDLFSRWQSNAGVPIEVLLARAADLSAEQLMETLAADMGERWMNGDRRGVDVYLASYPMLRTNADSAAFLAVVECQCRLRAGLTPVPDDYFARFPKASDDFNDLQHSQQASYSRVPNELAGSTSLSDLPCIPGYEILREIARGGMGVVYQARDLRLNRYVAIKVLRFPEASDLARFETEASAIAALSHPNIVTIHRYETIDHRPYLCLEYVDGVSLSQKLSGIPHPPRAAAHLLRVLATAVEHAHKSGIIHRDLKPSNILLPGVASDIPVDLGSVSPKITDFGLAKRIKSDSHLTSTGEIIGTPSYMAPEQAFGETAATGPATDVYSLGAVLYECICGRPPYVGAVQIEIIRRVCDELESPIPPSRIVAIPRDLETICLKCLEKTPNKRYQTAQALAEELGRFLACEPIHARRATLWERAIQRSRRHPQIALLAVGLTMFVVASVATLLWIANLEARSADEQVKLRKEAEQARGIAERRLVDSEATTGLALTAQGRLSQAVLWFANAAGGASDDPARRHLNEVRARSTLRVIPTPIAAIDALGKKVKQIVFHPDEKRIALKCDDGYVLFNIMAETEEKWPGGHRSIRAVAWSLDGKCCAIAPSAKEVYVHDLVKNEEPALLSFASPVELIEFSPDRRLAVVTGSSVHVWECERFPPLKSGTWEHPGTVRSVVFNRHGVAATSCDDGKARVFAFAMKSQRGELLMETTHESGGDGDVAPPVFCENGRTLVTRLGRVGLRWWDIATRREIFAAQTSRQIERLVPSPDEKHVALLHFLGAEIWDLDQKKQVGEQLDHDNFARAGAFSPDGRVFVTASDDRTARLWSVPDGSPLSARQYHEGHVQSTAFSPSGRVFATTQDDGLVRVWRYPDHLSEGYMLPVRDNLVFGIVSDRFCVPTGSHRDDAQLLSTNLHQLDTGVGYDRSGLRMSSVIVGGALDRSGKFVLALGKDPNVVSFWEASQTLRHIALEPLESQPLGAAISSDGSAAVVLCKGGEVVRFDPTTGRRRGKSLRHPGNPDLAMFFPSRWVRFSSDASRFATVGLGRLACVWETASGRLTHTLSHGDLVFDVDFSCDDLVATASRDKSVRVWDLTSEVAREFKRWNLPDWVFSARFSPDGRQVVTACRDFSARIYDTVDGNEAASPLMHNNEVYSAEFTPNGKLIVSTGRDKTVRVWDRISGSPLTPPWDLPGWGLQVTISPDGQWAIIGGFMKGLRVFSLSGLDVNTAQPIDEREISVNILKHIGELVSCQEIRDLNPSLYSAARNLTSKEWIERWTDYRRRYRDHGRDRMMLSASQSVLWHYREAVAAERSLAWYGAVWHYDRALENREGLAWEYGRRANANAEMSRWQEALRDFRRADVQAVDDAELWRSYALVHLGVGDREGYRETCAAMIQRFGETDDLDVLDLVEEACSLAPLSPDDVMRFLAIAKRAVEHAPHKMEFHQSLGVAYYRAEKWDKAIVELIKANELSPGGSFLVNDFFLAMCYQKRGDGTTARQHLDRANEMLKHVDQASLVQEVRLPWYIVLAMRLTQLEANSVVSDTR